MQLIYEHLVDSQSLENPKDAVILHYKNLKSGHVFTETIRAEDLIVNDYKEVLSVTANNNCEIIGINYSQQKLKRKELSGIEATVHKNLPGKDFVLTYVSAKKTGPS